jgi:hypothetical protein
MSYPSSGGFAGRRRPNPAGWAIVGGGWLILLLAIVFLVLRKDGSALYGVAAAVGAVCIAVGSYLAAGGRAFWAIPGALFSGFLLIFGFIIASHELKLQAHGTPVTCQVMQIRPETYTRTVTDSRGRRRIETGTKYWHTMKCPAGTYTVSSGSPDPVGAQLKMVQVPGETPEFAGSGGSAIGLGMGAVGGLIALALTIGAWVQSRRRATEDESAQYVPPMPTYPYAAAPPAGGGPASAPYPPGSYQPGPPAGGYPPAGQPSSPVPPPLPGQGEPGRPPGQQPSGPYEQW